MERLRFMPRDELLRVLHNNKTLMSCMERPHTFLSQLRDHGLIPEPSYKSASVLTNREKLKKAVYDILGQFERERPQDIHDFWACVLDGVIMDQYPTLRKLHNSLMDGSFHFDPQLLEKKRKAPSEDEEANSEKEKKKQRSSSSSDVEQPPPSPQLIPASSFEKEEADDVLASAIFKAQLPVTCGGLTGSLSRRRLAEGKRCILFRDQWLTPTEFERRAGRQSSRNWKLSIRCLGRTLGKLMQDGLLTPVKYKGGCKKAHNPLHPSDPTSTDEEEAEQQQEPEAEDDGDGSYVVFRVICERVDFEAAAEPEELGQDVGHFVEVSDEELTDEQDQLSEDEEKKSHSGGSVWEQAGQSAQLIPDSAARGWSLPSRLPVVCGDLEGELFTDRLAKGEKCILFQQQWFIPSEFERRAGKKQFKNWKLSIRHRGTPLGKLIQDGRLKSVKYKGGCKKAHQPQRASDHTATGGGDESSDRGGVFNVTCGALSGVLHAKRFASGACGRSIRTETGWMTPEEFVEESRQANASWENDVTCKGKALSVLREDNVLRIKCEGHSDETCEMDPTELENQKNDYECFVCKRTGSLEAFCEHCPRAFHQKCHLPPVANTDLSADKPWMCSFCEFKSYKNRDKLTMEEAMSQNISRHMLTCQYLLLCLCSADQTHNTRLSFVSVANKLQSREYDTVGEFVSDVQLIFTNQDRAASLACSELKELFDAELKEAFSILPDVTSGSEQQAQGDA